MEEKIREILEEVGGLVTAPAALGSNDDLFAAGLTSFATVNVMLGIEDAFDLEFPERLLTRTSFRSIAALAAAVREAQSAVDAG
ncbi:MAG: acyl carrier protein [Sphingomonas fennica]